MKKIRVYPHPAGGWPALGSSALSLLKQGTLLKGGASMRHANQPDGFDCPGCAWPDSSSHKAIDFCENGVKAVANEATSQRVTADFFAQRTVTELRGWSDYELERAGRLTEPMRYDAATDHYVPISWAQALAEIGSQLCELRESVGANAATFYTSGRTSNEAAFLYQLFIRAFGTNNMPDCSNMCHEATSVGLKQQIGIGKGTITLDDFDHAEAIFIFGQNPATNHPRMMGTLHEAVKRGCPILAFNPLREAGLEAFTNPQSPLEMLTGQGLPIAMRLYQVKIGGDTALLTGIIKAVLARDAEQGTVLDRTFIETQTSGFAEFESQIHAQSWADIEAGSGVSRAELDDIAEVYCASQATICTWGMGITQHQRGIDNVQMIVNLLLLRGNIGKTGAGAAPIRGHSNVQGDRTMGIYERPDAALLDRLEHVFSMPMPREHGVDVVDTLKGLADGTIQAFIALGGNFAAATPDTQNTYQALQNAKLTVQISTKLNRSHVVHGQSAYILPCLGRTEADWQDSGWQSVTTEDSMSRVMLSRGRNTPASDQLWSEPAIVAGLAQATLTPILSHQPVDWAALVADYDRIRDLIAQVIVGFEDFNQRVRAERGFYLGNSARDHVWHTSTAKAQFIAPSQPIHTPLADDLWMLTTVRSHDQYNTTIYALDDRYRNIHGERRVCFMHPDEIARLGWQVDQLIDLTSVFGSSERTVTGFKLKPFDLPAGCIASYYPETNDLIPLHHHTPRAQTPAYKSIPVRLTLSHESVL